MPCWGVSDHVCFLQYTPRELEQQLSLALLEGLVDGMIKVFVRVGADGILRNV